MLAHLKKSLKKSFIWNSYEFYRIRNVIKIDGIKYNHIQLFNEHNLEILFLHIPKTAGMSIVFALYNINKSNHATALDYFKEDKDKFNTTFSFAITRDPYARLYSAYSYLKNDGMNIVDKVWCDLYLSKYKNFNEFIIQGGLEFAIQKNAEHFIPQYKFIYNNQEQSLCNYVGKIENIQDVELYISKQLKKRINFTKKNVVNKAILSMKDLYTDEMIDIVNRCYEKDFALLGYKVMQPTLDNK